MKFIVAIFAIIGTVYAHCGCLKCSKHLSVAGVVPGAPGQAPVKVIYRSDNGYPSDAGLVGRGLIGGYLTAQPTVQIPAPAPVPEVPASDCGREIPVAIHRLYTPINGDYRGGRSYWDGSFFGRGFADGAYPEYEEGVLTNVGEVGILPVKVQIPEPVPALPTPACTPIEGLTTCLDRVIVSRPPFVYEKHGKQVIPTCCGPITCPLHGCGLYPARYLPPAPAAHQSSSCSCSSRYESISPVKHFVNPTRFPRHNRSKRQLPVVQNGYKFMMNMLPKFIKEPIMKTVNSMALTHPDKKLQTVYNLHSPQQSFQERLADKHKEKVASIKSKIFGKPTLKQYVDKVKYEDEYYPSKYRDGDRYYPRSYVEEHKYYSNKYNDHKSPAKKHYKDRSFLNDYVTEQLVNQETQDFIDSLHHLKSKSKYPNTSLKQRKDLDEYPRLVKQRSPVLKDHFKEDYWIKEFNSNEILDDPIKDSMSAKDKARFLLKLKKLNKAHKIAKRNVDEKKKRSIIIDSEELSLPLYQIRIKDSDEENEIDTDYDDNYSEEDFIVSSHHKDMSTDDILRKAIREELYRFKEDNANISDELDIAPHFKKEWISKYPLLHILSLPAKVMSSLNDKDAFPMVKAVPKMLVGTKRYFKNFGKNFKKNLLHFTSDMIGDFEDYTPTDRFLDRLVTRRRFKRDLTFNETMDNSIDSGRKKRYILKMVDDDEIEQLLKEKLGRMIGAPENSNKVKKKFKSKHNKIENSEEQRKIVEHLYGGLKNQLRSSEENHSEHIKKRKNNTRLKSKRITSHEDSIEQIRKKIVIEPVKPKLIIDNHGLPFMEVNGFKRPLFIKKGKKKDYEQHSIENTSFDPYDSSEEGNLQKITQVINRARDKNNLPSRSADIPLQAVKEKISHLLTDIDLLIYMDCKKFDQIYDDLNEIQSIKKSIVQSWKRLIMDKQINEYDAKIGLLEKFTELQEIKNTAVKNIVSILQQEKENSFVVKKLTGDLVGLQKMQCIINQVVDSFQEKFKTGAKFDVALEIKYVDFLTSLKFVKAKTRNEMIRILEYERDMELQENIQLLEKLKRLLVDDDDNLIEEEANILWEMKHVQNMQISTIEEMGERLDSGMKIKKCLKILFDLQRRLTTLEAKEKQVCNSNKHEEKNDNSEESDEGSENKKESEELKVSNEKNHKNKTKFKLEESKRKWQEKLEKHKHLIEDNHKKRVDKFREIHKILKSSEEND